jgi:hypothetical protein
MHTASYVGCGKVGAVAATPHARHRAQIHVQQTDAHTATAEMIPEGKQVGK